MRLKVSNAMRADSVEPLIEGVPVHCACAVGIAWTCSVFDRSVGKSRMLTCHCVITFGAKVASHEARCKEYDKNGARVDVYLIYWYGCRRSTSQLVTSRAHIVFERQACHFLHWQYARRCSIKIMQPQRGARSAHIGRLQLVLVIIARPLVAGGVAEFVAVGRDEVVQDSRATRSCTMSVPWAY